MRRPFLTAAMAMFVGLSGVVSVPGTAVAAMGEEERDSTFWKVAVIDFQGKTPAVDGGQAAFRFATALRNSKRFHVLPPGQVRRAVRKLKIDASNAKISEADARKLCKELEIDGVFVGKIERGTRGGGVMTIALHSGNSGRLFAQYRFNITPRFPLPEASKIAKSYTARLPYDGMVVSVDRDLALVNLGTANGLANGSRLYAFEFERMRRDAAGLVLGGDRKALAELEVVNAQRHGAYVRPIKGDAPVQFTKISLKPIAGVADLKPSAEVKAAAASAVPARSLEVDADVAFLFKSYQLSGDGARYTSDTTLFPAPGIKIHWFPTRKLGGSLRFRHGFIPFRRPVTNTGTGDGRFETYSGAVDQITAEAHLRKVFGAPGYFAGGSLTAGAGLAYSSFTIEDQTPRVLTNDTYIGPIVSGELRVPLLERINAHTRLSVIPIALVDEKPLDNGNGTGFGLGATVGLEYHMTEKLLVSFDYGLDTMQTRFPAGGGSRGISNPKSSDLYHGVTVTLGWRKYR